MRNRVVRTERAKWSSDYWQHSHFEYLRKPTRCRYGIVLSYGFSFFAVNVKHHRFTQIWTWIPTIYREKRNFLNLEVHERSVKGEVIDTVSTKNSNKTHSLGLIRSSAVAGKPCDVPCHTWKRFLRLSI